MNIVKRYESSFPSQSCLNKFEKYSTPFSSGMEGNPCTHGPSPSPPQEDMMRLLLMFISPRIYKITDKMNDKPATSLDQSSLSIPSFHPFCKIWKNKLFKRLF